MKKSSTRRRPIRQVIPRRTFPWVGILLYFTLSSCTPKGSESTSAPAESVAAEAAAASAGPGVGQPAQGSPGSGSVAMPGGGMVPAPIGTPAQPPAASATPAVPRPIGIPASPPVASAMPAAPVIPEEPVATDGMETLDIDPRRSLLITELDLLAAFSLERVMNQLASQIGEPGLTGIALFRQLWDTQNSGPGLGLGPHCDDVQDDALGTVLNGFPYDCRPAPAEGAQASCTSFDDEACAYIPIALVNRFDLMDEDASHCGQYRIIHAKRSGQSNSADRNFIIWETGYVNPDPANGLQGCLSLVNAWVQLSAIDDLSARSTLLEEMYFVTVGGALPIVHASHYGNNSLGAGQIRTNQFMGQDDDLIWTLREFKLRPVSSTGEVRFVPVANATNPWGGLFAPDVDHEQVPQFLSWLPGQLENLLASELNLIGMEVPDALNSGQSHSSGSTDTDYLTQFGTEASDLRTALVAALENAGSSLTPEQIVNRAQAQSCAGCHQLSANADLGDGLIWPASLDFVHVSEIEPEVVDGVQRYRVSPALTDVFLPFREENLQSFVMQGRAPRHRPGAVH